MLAEITAIKVALHELAAQTYNLAMGLQNVAPPQAPAGSTIKYLIEISLKLEKLSQEIEVLMSQAAK